MDAAGRFAKNGFKTIGISSGLMLSCHLGFGIGIYVPDQDAEAAARADTFIAKADNPAAVYYNPAGLTQLAGWNCSGSLLGIQMRPRYRGTASGRSREAVQVLAQCYATFHPTNHALAFGLGLTTPFGLGIDYGADSPLRQSVVRDSLQFLSVNGVVAWQITPTFCVAAGPTCNFAALSLAQGLAPVNSGDLAKFAGSGTSVGGSVGVRWSLERFSLGAIYRGSGPIRYSGDFAVQPGVLPIPAANEPAHLQLAIPSQIGFGLGCAVTERMQVEVDALWTQWSSWDEATLAKPSGNLSTQYQWQDSWILSGATTWEVRVGTAVHLGYGYAQPTIPDHTFTAAIPDSARHVISFGLSQNLGAHLRGTVTFQEVFGTARHIQNAATLPGTYSFGSTAVSTSLVFRF